MTFNLLSINMWNFKSFAGKHSFSFPQEPGLYFLTGKNEFNKRLGANACGKTSFIDAIEWCLYGKTSRNLKASDVVFWGEKSCSVELTFVLGDEEATVKRTQKPNQILKNDKPVSQEELDLFLRVNQEAFNSSVVLPQFGEAFFDLSPTQKLALFSQVMALDFWLEKSQLADTKAKEKRREIERVENTIANLQGRLVHARETLKEHKAASHIFEQEKTKEILKLESKRETYAVAIEDKENDLEKAKAEYKEVKSKASSYSSKIEKYTNKIQEASKKTTQLETEIRFNLRQAKELETEVASMENLSGGPCPVCKQEVGTKHVKAHTAKKKEKAEALTKKVTEAGIKIEELNGIVKEYKTRKARLVEKEDKANTAIRVVTRKVANAEAGMNEAVRQLRSFEKELLALKTKENVYTSMIKSTRESISKFKQEVAVLKEASAELKVSYDAIYFWVQGFKRIRLYVIEEALTNLELEVNNHLIQLGLVDWSINFDVERENKSGGITKGFSVLINSPKSEDPIKWESFSGGETQRLRLAGDLGLSNLILSQAGLTGEIEIIDEPSAHLSVEGIEDLIETLQQRASDANKRIWLVDHSIKNFGNFAGVVTARMDAQGKSTLEITGNERVVKNHKRRAD